MGNIASPVVCFTNAGLEAYYKLIQSGQQVFAWERPDELVFSIGKKQIEQSQIFPPVPVVTEETSAERYILLYQDEVGISVSFRDKGQETVCSVLEMPAQSALYARTAGLLESDMLATKKVAVVGLGSFGSHIAVELAKCGIGSFGLFDYDRLEPGNVTRHVCGLADIGRLKVHAVRDMIYQCNPFAKVDTFPADVNVHKNEFLGWVQNADLLICVTDENRSRINCTNVALRTGKTAIFGRAITRAEGGDVLRFRPSHSPCIACLVGNGIFDYRNEEISTVQQSKRGAPAYMDAKDVEAQVQVGLSNDIVPLWNMVVRLALVELMGGAPGIFEKQEQDFMADYYFWANRRENRYSSLLPMRFSAITPSILRWYGVKLSRNSHCLICGNKLP